MLPPRLRPRLYAYIALAFVLSLLAYFLPEPLMIGITVLFWPYLLFYFIKREPEIVKAEVKMEKAQKPWTYAFLVLVVIGTIFTDIEKPGILGWVVIFSILASFAAFYLIWPGIVYNRAQGKVRHRKSREAEKP